MQKLYKINQRGMLELWVENHQSRFTNVLVY